jgi:hypothetical protein
LNILITGKEVLGFTDKMDTLGAICVLTVGHFALLSRLDWQQAGDFWLPVVVGIPELVDYFCVGANI